MRKTLSLAIVGMVLLGLATAVPRISAAQDPPKTEKPAPAITGSGCVETGVEAGCLVLKDAKTGTLYNLFFAGKKPSIDMAIEFKGTAHEGPTTCMQGKPVDVKGWKQTRMHCPTPPSPSDKKP